MLVARGFSFQVSRGGCKDELALATTDVWVPVMADSGL